jgi:hypothetical protein
VLSTILLAGAAGVFGYLVAGGADGPGAAALVRARDEDLFL